ncbi:MAG TPA: S53 family peptidase [Acidimicrobiia bacterium]
MATVARTHVANQEGARVLNKKRTTSIAAAGAFALLGSMALGGLVGVGTAGATASRSVLPQTSEASAARAHPVGAVAQSSPVDFELVLQLRDAAGAQALVQSISTPGSANFRHYLTAAQWEARFSPKAAQVHDATAWLQSEGFAVGKVSADRVTVAASGTAAQVERAFGTTLDNYKFRGQTVRFAAGNLSVPASLAGNVIGAIGINQNVNTPAIANDDAATASPTTATSSAGNPFPPAPAAFITSPPCGSYYGQKNTTDKPAFGRGYPSTVPDQVCGYQPAQLRSAYGLTNKNTGAGVTVAIIDAYGSSTIAQDATKFYNTYDPSIPFSNAHFQQADALPFDDEALCAASGWATEQDLDVEAVHTMAPKANILYVGAQDCVNGLFDADQAVIDQGAANIVTNSWGDVGGDLLDDSSTRQAFDDEFMLADSTGITVNFSTGDDGDNFDLIGVSAAGYPASSPFVTAVGGTTMKIGANGQRTGDLGWATGRSFLCTKNVENAFPGCSSKTVNTWGPVSYDGGSGGYTSYNYTQPFYQARVVPTSLATRNSPIIGDVATRVIPDISMDADAATGELMGLHETFPNGQVKFGLTRFGGTSLASPLLAGELADVDQAAGVSVGFVNPDMYRLVTKSGAIDDVRPGGKQAQYRTDLAASYVPVSGLAESFREITYEGVVTYCDGTGNCASRNNTLSTANGYDSMTGLGTIGPKFLADLAG